MDVRIQDRAFLHCRIVNRRERCGIIDWSVLTTKSTSTVHLCNPFCSMGQRRGRC